MSKKAKKIEELYNWLDQNKIVYKIIDNEVTDIPDFGKTYFQDTSKLNSILRRNIDNELEFNFVEAPEVLEMEGIRYVVYKFGDNFYYQDIKGDFQLNILKYVGQRKPSEYDIEYVNLGIHTAYELLNGSFMPDMWVKKAKYLGMKALGICDQNTMAACFTFQKECEAAGINPVFGYSLKFTDEEWVVGAKIYVGSQIGFRHLLRIQKAIMVDNVESKMIALDDLLERGMGNIVVLDKYSSEYILSHPDTISKLFEAFDNVFYQVDLSEYKAERIDVKVLESTKLYFDSIYTRRSNPRPVLISDCYYLDKTDAKNKIILNKIAEGAAHEQSDEQYFKDADEQYALFQQTFDQVNWDIHALFMECCNNTLTIANAATAKFDITRNFMPKYDMTPEEKEKYGTVHNMFNELLEEGLQRLTPKGKEEQYRKQMEYEKYIIESTDNVDYLLVQYDTCNWARRNNILVGCGRGSAAGSLLLYLLGITLIDPIKYDLIFERFLLPERAGLYPTDVTVIGEDIASSDYMEVKLDNGKNIKIDKDAELMVKRGEEEIKVYADELQEGDDILFDNKDQLFTINEI